MITEVTDFNSDSVEGLYAKTKAEAARYVMDAVKNQKHQQDVQKQVLKKLHH